MTLSNEKRRERYQNDAEYRQKILDRCKNKYHNNEEYRKDKIKSVVKYGKTHKEYNKEKYRQYYKDNTEKMKLNAIFHYRNDRNEVLYWYSNGNMKCNICGETHIEFLCIDHINDDGADHRKEIGIGGGRIHRYLINNNFPDGYQVLCNNCNYLKEYDRIHDKSYSNTNYAIAARKQRLKIRLNTLYWYSNGTMKCECCGESDDRLLTIDHIYGGGKQHFLSNNIKNLYENLFFNNFPEDGYRVLCWNCNKSYGQYGYCPHY